MTSQTAVFPTCLHLQVGTPSTSTNADPLLLSFLPFLDASRGCGESKFLAKTGAYRPPHPLILLTTFDRFKPSCNINPLLTPLLSSRYGPSSSETKHPKGWAATFTIKGQGKPFVPVTAYFG